MIDVLNAYRAAANGQGVHTASLLTTDPPHAVWQGLSEYSRFNNLIRDSDSKKK